MVAPRPQTNVIGRKSAPHTAAPTLRHASFDLTTAWRLSLSAEPNSCDLATGATGKREKKQTISSRVGLCLQTLSAPSSGARSATNTRSKAQAENKSFDCFPGEDLKPIMAPVQDQDFFGGAIRGVVPQGWIDARSVYSRVHV